MKVDGYYDAFLESRDPARRVGWRSALEQSVRFEIAQRLVTVDGSLLDLGCGTGALGNYLRNAGWRGRYIGVDAYPHQRLNLENAEYHQLDFRDLPAFKVDTVVAIGALVGNDSPTSLEALLEHLYRAQESFLLVGLSKRFLNSTYHDLALQGFELSDLPKPTLWKLDQHACLVTDTCVVGQRAQTTQLGEATQWLSSAKRRTDWTTEELAWVCAQLGLEEEILRLRNENPLNEEVQLAFEKWQFWHEISLA